MPPTDSVDLTPIKEKTHACFTAMFAQKLKTGQPCLRGARSASSNNSNFWCKTNRHAIRICGFSEGTETINLDAEYQNEAYQI